MSTHTRQVFARGKLPARRTAGPVNGVPQQPIHAADQIRTLTDTARAAARQRAEASTQEQP